MSQTEQITAFVGYLTLIVVVGIVATTYNLAGDGESLREGIVNHLTVCIRIDVHVTAVSSTVEGTDGTILQVLIPFQCSLDIHLYWLEIEVDEVRVDQRSLCFLRWQIKNIDVIVGRIVLPVDGIG